MRAIFVSDIHGNEVNFRKLCSFIRQYLPEAVYIGGDVLPNHYITDPEDFIKEFLKPLFTDMKEELNVNYPDIFLIPGNDDAAVSCEYFELLETKKLLHFAFNKIISNGDGQILAYPYTPPSPFLLKDWEKYDVSRYLPGNMVSPEEGLRTIDVPANIQKYSTIKDDLKALSEEIRDFKKTICLFHAPPYDTNLDKIYGKNIKGNDEIISVGSIAIKRFIEKHQPHVTLHGHIHESSEISGSWMDKIGDTYCFNAAYNGNELAVIQFDTKDPGNAERMLV